MAFLLIGAGADPFVRNGSGLLAADLTTSIAIRALLLDAGRLPAVRLRVPRELISKIVGKGGDRLQTLQHRTVTVIKLPPRDSLSDEIFVRGLADGIAAVKEFFIDGIISDGKSLTNVHDVRSPPLPVSVRSDSPLMLTAPEQPLLPTHKRSSSLGCDTLGVPMALEIRSDSEPRTKSRGFAAAAPALDAAGSAAAITDTSTTNSNGIADTGTGTGTTTNSTPTTNSSCNNISSATTATNTTVNTTSNTAVPPSPETSTKKKKRTSAKAAASEADSSHVGDVQTSLSMSNSLSLSDEKFACSSSSDKSVSRSSSGRAFDFEVPAI